MNNSIRKKRNRSTFNIFSFVFLILSALTPSVLRNDKTEGMTTIGQTHVKIDTIGILTAEVDVDVATLHNNASIFIGINAVATYIGNIDSASLHLEKVHSRWQREFHPRQILLPCRNVCRP